MVDLLKFVLLILVGVYVINWMSNRLVSSLQSPTTNGGTIVGDGWAPYLSGSGRVRRWAAPWNQQRGGVTFGNGNWGGTVSW